MAHSEDIIRGYEINANKNPSLAQVWLDQPFNRAAIAEAFEAGYTHGPNAYSQEVKLIARIDALERKLKGI